MGWRRQVTMAICPTSIFDTSSSAGAPSALARSEGDHEAINGTAANTAPTAPVATVAVVRNLRRLRSTASSPTTTFSAINRSPAYCPTIRVARRAPLAARDDNARTRAVSGLRGAAHYTQTNTTVCASGCKEPVCRLPAPQRSTRKDQWMRGLIFLAGSVVGGLALA